MAVTGAPSSTGIQDLMRTFSAARSTNAPATAQAPAASSQPADRSADSVSLSPLASALKGNALKIFNGALTDDDHKKLDDAVRAGTLSGEDVAKGLETRMKRIGLAFGGDLKVAAVDLDEGAVNRLLGAALPERGQRPMPRPEETRERPSIMTKKAPAQDAHPVPDRLAYLTSVDPAGDDAARKMSELGVNLGTFSDFGTSVLRMFGKGLFDYS